MKRRRLTIKLDHVATLRQVRRSTEPDPITAASIARMAGANGVSAHLREDSRHIQERDLKILRQTVAGDLCLEIGPNQEMLKVAYDVKPNVVTLVAERREERSTEAGLDVQHHRDRLRGFIQNLREGESRICLSVDADIEQVRAVHRVGVPAVRLHSGKFATARGSTEQRTELQRIADAARAASKLGMAVAVGGSLNYDNVTSLVDIEDIEEFVIGHAIVARAIMVGMDRAVRDMAALVKS